MANDKSKKTNGNRYSGVDSMPWVVKDTKGETISGSFTSYKEADSAATTHRNVTGMYAQAVRA